MKVELRGQMESIWPKHPHLCKIFSMEKDLSTDVKRNWYIQEQAKRPMSRASFVFLHDLLVIIHQ